MLPKQKIEQVIDRYLYEGKVNVIKLLTEEGASLLACRTLFNGERWKQFYSIYNASLHNEVKVEYLKIPYSISEEKLRTYFQSSYLFQTFYGEFYRLIFENGFEIFVFPFEKSFIFFKANLFNDLNLKL